MPTSVESLSLIDYLSGLNSNLLFYFIYTKFIKENKKFIKIKIYLTVKLIDILGLKLFIRVNNYIKLYSFNFSILYWYFFLLRTFTILFILNLIIIINILIVISASLSVDSSFFL